MANYSKRDARKAWVAGMIARDVLGAGGDHLPRCACGEPAVLEVPLFSGTQYFRGAYQGDGNRMFPPARPKTGRGMSVLGALPASEALLGDGNAPR